MREVLRAANGRPGHIFNLGHGIVPETSVESVLRVVDWVKEFGVAKSAPKSPTEPVSEWAVRA